MLRKLLRGLGILAGLIALALGTLYLIYNQPRPSGTPGAEADALARQIEQAVNREAWDNTRAVQWTFRGKNRHLWDRARELHRVRWQDGDTEVEVLLHLNAPEKGQVTRDGQKIDPSDPSGAHSQTLKKAYAAWINDSFWLNPLVKLFDEGTQRLLVEPKNGQRRLMLQYMSGGLTPGDSYLYTLDAQNVPVSWEMWVSIIPIGGVYASWEGWTTLASGAKVSTHHRMGPMDLVLSDVKSADSAAELNGGVDPFLALVTP